MANWKRAVGWLALLVAVSACQVSIDIGTGTGLLDEPYWDLEAGDCIASFASLHEFEGNPETDLGVVGCDVPHELEVSAIVDISDEVSVYPGEAAMEFQAGVRCLEVFRGYVGIDAWDTMLISGQIFPTTESWEDGDRQLTCLVHHRERITLNGTTRSLGDALLADLGRRVSMQSLQVGDCINNAALFRYTGEFSVTEDCDDLHEAEVYHTEEITVFGTAYPGDEPLRNYVRERCANEVADYLGGSLEDANLNSGRFGPDEFGWLNHNRTMVCVLTDLEPGTRFAGSVAARE